MIKVTKLAIAILPNYLVFNHLFKKEFVNRLLIIFTIWGEEYLSENSINAKN